MTSLEGEKGLVRKKLFSLNHYKGAAERKVSFFHQNLRGKGQLEEKTETHF